MTSPSLQRGWKACELQHCWEPLEGDTVIVYCMSNVVWTFLFQKRERETWEVVSILLFLSSHVYKQGGKPRIVTVLQCLSMCTEGDTVIVYCSSNITWTYLL